MRRARPLTERFTEKVNYNGPIHPVLGTRCHLWTGKLHVRYGHGQFSVDGKWMGAHRWLYEHVHGALPDGFCALHRCDVPNCVNVDHLFAGTRADNVYDMVAKKRHRPVRGELIGTAKLTYEVAERIRMLRREVGLRICLLADLYGVSETTVGNVIHGRTWNAA